MRFRSFVVLAVVMAGCSGSPDEEGATGDPDPEVRALSETIELIDCRSALIVLRYLEQDINERLPEGYATEGSAYGSARIIVDFFHCARIRISNDAVLQDVRMAWIRTPLEGNQTLNALGPPFYQFELFTDSAPLVQGLKSAGFPAQQANLPFVEEPAFSASVTVSGSEIYSFETQAGSGEAIETNFRSVSHVVAENGTRVWMELDGTTNVGALVPYVIVAETNGGVLATMPPGTTGQHAGEGGIGSVRGYLRFGNL